MTAPASDGGASAPAPSPRSWPSGRPEGARFLFVGGCQRSGTTEFTWILNAHPSIGLGMERFKRLARPRTVHRYRPELFDRMFAFDDGNTNVTPDAPEWDRFYRQLARKWPRLRIIGDKVPTFFGVYDRMAAAFPDARFVQLIRNPLPVAGSWAGRARQGRESWPAENDHLAGIRAWNEANAAAVAMAEARPERFLAVSYEWFFSGDRAALDHVAGFLDLEMRADWATAYERRTQHWDRRRARRPALSAAEADAVVAGIDWRAWEAVRALMRSA